MNKKCKKAINFDLSEELLRLHYPKSIKYAWKEIGKYLKDNGFKHRQYSGYVSKHEMEDSQLLAMIYDMRKKFPWLECCAIQFDVTDIGKTYDVLTLQIDKIVPTRKEKVHTPTKGRVSSGSAFVNAQKFQKPEQTPQIPQSSEQEHKPRMKR